MNIDVSIIIANFNGKKLLNENLPILFSRLAVSAFSKSCEIIVVDDCSSDDSVTFIRDNFPQVKLITLGKNRGFSYACNAGAKKAAGRIVYFLDNDVKVCEGFLEPLINHFEKEDTFAVCSAEVLTADTAELEKEVVIPLVKFKWGIFWYWYECVPNEASHSCEAFCVSGGHFACDRKKFFDLGGFDDMFRPFYAEDGDICWRAWKMGWKSIYEPKSRVQHICQATIGKHYADADIQRIHWKNRFLMTWKNLYSGFFLFKHIIFTIPESLICPFIGKTGFTPGFYSALKQLPELIKSRKRDRVAEPVFSDEAFFKRFSRPPRLPPFRILCLQETSLISGAENSLMKLAENMDKIKFKPIFILPSEGPFSRKLRQLGIEVILINFSKVCRVAGACMTVKEMLRVIKEKNAALIHSNSIRTNIYAAIAGRLSGIPVIWHQRNLITNEIVDPDRLLSFMPDRIICNSYAIARRFTRKADLPAKLRVVHNGVDIKEFNPAISGGEMRKEFNIRSDEIVVGIASRFNEYKGHDIFLQAVKIILTEMPEIAGNLRFLIAGGAVFEQDKPREKYLQNIVKNLNVGDKVIFTGFRDDMPKIYAAMDIFILASYTEPCGRVILEAMACAKPVIATDSGGTPEIVIDGVTGRLFKPNDARMLADKTAFLAGNITIAKKFGEAGRRRIEENFKIEKNVEQIEKNYMELINPSTHPSLKTEVCSGLILSGPEFSGPSKYQNE